ncbi:MAG TPA: hypothetical protein VGN01_19185 [Acidobacteriaceae bacterium]
MSGIIRNIAVILFGAVTSVLTAAVLLFLEARSGQALFGYQLWQYVPVGAVGAGLLAAIGYLLGSLVLRVRPANVVAVAIVLVAGFTVFMGQSAELGMMMLAGRNQPRDVASFTHFLGDSVMHTQLSFSLGGGDSSSSSSSSASSSFGAAPSMPSTGGGSDSRTDGISSGVSNMMATQDVSNMGPVHQVGQMGDDIHSLGAGVSRHSTQWAVWALQVVGFAIGGLLAFSYLRTLSFCKNCMLLLSKKGAQTRYYDRSDDIRSSTDDVLTAARSRRLQQSIAAHKEKGSKKRGKWSEFASTIEILRCGGCNTHRLSFSARRKEGAGWKEIAPMAYSASSLEPLNVG